MVVFDGALVTEQNVTFAIVVVKPYVLYTHDKESIRAYYSKIFGGIPTIMMSQNARGIPIYDGRRDIVHFLAKTNPKRIPWKRYKVA